MEFTPDKTLPNMGGAIMRWISFGRPMRSDEELKRLKDYCGSCRFFDRGACGLMTCCNTNPKEGARVLEHKQIMGTESCPAGLWAGAPGNLTIVDSKDVHG